MKPERIQERTGNLTGWARHDSIQRTFAFESLKDLLDFAQILVTGGGDASIRVAIEGRAIAVTLTAGKKGFQPEDIDLAKALNAAYRSRAGRSGK